MALVLLFIGVTKAQLTIKEEIPFNLKTVVYPGDQYRVKIDGELQEVSNVFKLSRGKHHIEIWAPHFERFDTTMWFSSKMQVLTVVLEKTQQLKNFEISTEQSSFYRRNMGVATVAGIGLAGVMIYNSTRISKFTNEVRRAKFGKENGILKYDNNVLQKAKNKNTKAWILQGVAIGGFAYATYTYVKNYLLYKKLDYKKLKEDKSFLVDAFVLPAGDQGVYGGIILKF